MLDEHADECRFALADIDDSLAAATGSVLASIATIAAAHFEEEVC